jgi:hypothetical protein
MLVGDDNWGLKREEYGVLVDRIHLQHKESQAERGKMRRYY